MGLRPVVNLMNRLRLTFGVIFVATIFLLAAAIGQVPSTKTAPAGGRHGKFHFITDEQIAADANRPTQIRERLASLKKDAAKLAKDDIAKQRLLSELGTFEAFVNSVEYRDSHPAGPVAAQAEAILNEKKGMMQCTFCHEAGEPGHVAPRGARQK
jgi:hypothetical protein